MTQDLLSSIFGGAVCNLTDSEIAVADKVINWFCAKGIKNAEISESESRLIDACCHALEKEGTNWESIMLNRTRKKEIVGYRDAIISIVWDKSYGTQAHKASLLGGMLTRSTIIHAVNSAKDWIEYDKSYRELYENLSKSINEYLKNL